MQIDVQIGVQIDVQIGVQIDVQIGVHEIGGSRARAHQPIFRVSAGLTGQPPHSIRKYM